MYRLILVTAVVSILISCNHPANRIQVAGHASMMVVPDMVELSLKAYNVQPAMKDAVKETQLAIRQILDVCHKYIKDESRIKVSNVSTNKAYEYVGNREVFKGYSAQQILQVTLTDVSQIEHFTEELLATKIASIYQVTYDHSRADSIQREVNLMALADAKATAEKMCSTMDVKLGKTIYLSNFQDDNDSYQASSAANNYELNLYNKSFGGPAFRMTAEILEFRNVAFAGFEINP
jgi:uncharacterized protein YggE